MTNYLDTKINEILELTLQLKRYHMHSHPQTDGVSMLQLEILKYVKTNKKLTMGDVASYLKISMSSSTQLIERLVGGKYIKRIHDIDDRRIVMLEITDEGIVELERSLSEMKDRMRKMYATLTQNELDEYIKISRKIISNLAGDK